jgi:hypothetical protein
MVLVIKGVPCCTFGCLCNTNAKHRHNIVLYPNYYFGPAKKFIPYPLSLAAPIALPEPEFNKKACYKGVAGFL